MAGERDVPWRLLNRILASSWFRSDPPLAELLRRICVATWTGAGDEAPEEPDAATATLLEEIRSRLKLYFAHEGKREPIRLGVPKGELRAYLYEADPRRLAALESEPGALVRFWAPYFAPGAVNRLLHGESAESALSIPEAYTLVVLSLLFERHDSAIELFPASSTGADCGGANLILTGLPHSNPVLQRFCPTPVKMPHVRRIAAGGDHGVVTILTAPSEDALLVLARLIATEGDLQRFTAAFEGSLPAEFDLTLSPPDGNRG